MNGSPTPGCLRQPETQLNRHSPRPIGSLGRRRGDERALNDALAGPPTTSAWQQVNGLNQRSLSLVRAQNSQIWTDSALARIVLTAAQIGGSRARGADVPGAATFGHEPAAGAQSGMTVSGRDPVGRAVVR